MAAARTRTRRSTRTANASEEETPKKTPRRKSTSTTRRTKTTRKEDAGDDEPSTPPFTAATLRRPFTPVATTGKKTRVRTAAASAVEDAASLLNTVHETIQKSPIVSRISESTQRIQLVKLSPSILASFVLAIIVSGIISVSVVPLFYEQSDPEVGAGLLQIQRKLHKLETNLEDIKGKLTSYASNSDIAQLKEQQKAVLDKQAALSSLMKKELDKLKVEHISNERIKTEVARAIASRADPADYASYNANGRVIGHSNLYPRAGDPWLLPSREGDWYLFSLPYVKGLPKVLTSALRRVFPVHPKASIWLLSIPSTGYEIPGHCLPLNGSSGYVDIQLRRAIQLKSVSIEHISRISAYNITTAPKQMKLYSLKAEDDGSKSKEQELASFVYNIQSTPVQVFPIKLKQKLEVSRVRLEVESNYGNEDYTCLYRFKAYGEPLT